MQSVLLTTTLHCKVPCVICDLSLCLLASINTTDDIAVCHADYNTPRQTPHAPHLTCNYIDLQASTSVQHLVLPCHWTQRSTIVADMIKSHGCAGRSIVFTDTKKDANELTASLSENCGAMALHGDIPQVYCLCVTLIVRTVSQVCYPMLGTYYATVQRVKWPERCA